MHASNKCYMTFNRLSVQIIDLRPVFDFRSPKWRGIEYIKIVLEALGEYI